jgi:hypothetical protein
METTQPTTTLGKIVKSNSHVDYVCQVYGRGEVNEPPLLSAYAFGTFAAIGLDGAAELVGVIYNTLLLNPEFGSLGPRLSPQSQIEVFSPDYLAETATLVGVFALGWFDALGEPHQGVPALAAAVNAPVRRLSEDELCRFHGDGRGRVLLRYAPLLLNQNNALAAPLLIEIVDHLGVLFPGSRNQLAVMRNNLAWKSIVQPVG